MVAPLVLLAGIGAISTFLGAYQAYQSKQVSDYQSAYQLAKNRDTENFYAYYQRRTGQKIRFPYYSGSRPDYSNYYHSRYASNTAYYGTAQRVLGLAGLYAGRYQRNPPYNGNYVGMYS